MEETTNTVAPSAWDDVAPAEGGAMIKWADENKNPLVGKVVVMIPTKHEERPAQNAGSISHTYEAVDNEGAEIFFYAPTDLNQKLEKNINKICRVEVEGQKTTNNKNKMTIFKVQVLEDTPENRVKVQFVEASW